MGRFCGPTRATESSRPTEAVTKFATMSPLPSGVGAAFRSGRRKKARSPAEPVTVTSKKPRRSLTWTLEGLERMGPPFIEGRGVALARARSTSDAVV
jgi:hypothetical protein